MLRFLFFFFLVLLFSFASSRKTWTKHASRGWNNREYSLDRSRADIIFIIGDVKARSVGGNVKSRRKEGKVVAARIYIFMASILRVLSLQRATVQRVTARMIVKYPGDSPVIRDGRRITTKDRPVIRF